MVTAREIINAIVRDYPQKSDPNVIASPELNLKITKTVSYRYLLTLTKADHFAGEVNIERYKNIMGNFLHQINLDCHCTGWPFKGHEKEEAKEVAQELSDHFLINLDIEKNFGRLDIRTNDAEKYFYIVMTIIPLTEFELE
ncbi:MAG: hypothetical protein GXC78_16690 [Chitinophagaceae bacterium]|jgi:hypothetical protein|nr:hypothetical protein [Chitinophagaceae bacterium]